MLQTTVFLRELVYFLKTVTIKNSYLAEITKVNQVSVIYQDTISDTDNPYYRHLSGEYILKTDTTNGISNAQLYTRFDTMMQVISFDTGEVIDFTKANLALHPKTAAEYRLPGTRYLALCAKYPTQDALIKSIVYPISAKNEAISASNFTMLGYDETLLQEAERASLIQALTDFLIYFKARWDVKEYRYEQYFPLLQDYILWYCMIYILHTQRICNLHTSSAHPFQILEYLTSKGLKDYRTILSAKQEQFLYKNIDYLLSNKGKNKTLLILANALLSDYGVELRTKSLVLNTTNATRTCLPTAEVISEAVEQHDNTPTENVQLGIETIPTIITREYNDKLEPSVSSLEIAKQQNIFDNMGQTYLPTKIIELNKIPLNARFTKLYFNFIADSLLYQHIRNRLSYRITLSNNDLDNPLILTASEAIALLMYCICREQNRTLNTIPSAFEIRHALRDTITNVPTTVTHYLTDIHVNVPVVSLDTPTAIDAPDVGHTLNPVETNITTPSVIPDINTPVTLGPNDDNSYVTYSHYSLKPNSVLGGDANNLLKLTTIENDLGGQVTSEALVGQLPLITGVFRSNTSLINTLDNQFDILYYQLLYGLDSNDTLHNLAMKNIMQRYMVTQLFENCALIPTSVATTYNAWFASSPELTVLINLYNTKPDANTEYGALANSIIDQLIPLSNSKFTLAEAFDSSRYKYMRDLLTQMCSYNITFIDTNRTVNEYTVQTPVVARSVNIRTSQTIYWPIDDILTIRPTIVNCTWHTPYGIDCTGASHVQPDTAANIIN